MRAPPPVTVRGTGGPVWRAVQAALFALAAGAGGLWMLDLLQFASWPAALVMPPVGLLAWRACAAPSRQVAWDGRDWSLDGVAGRLDVMIDLGAWLLLRLRPHLGGRVRWAAFERREAAGAWHALRAAVHAPVPAADPQGAA